MSAVHIQRIAVRVKEIRKREGTTYGFPFRIPFLFPCARLALKGRKSLRLCSIRFE